MSDFGIFKTFADVHISDSSQEKMAALRGADEWEVSSGGQANHSGRKSFNLHPGGTKESRGSAGCATVMNRAAGGNSRDYFVFMETIQSFAFHSDAIIGDQYDPSNAAVKDRIDLDAVYLKKIIVY